jgi:hypothetical protein
MFNTSLGFVHVDNLRAPTRVTIVITGVFQRELVKYTINGSPKPSFVPWTLGQSNCSAGRSPLSCRMGSANYFAGDLTLYSISTSNKQQDKKSYYIPAERYVP